MFAPIHVKIDTLDFRRRELEPFERIRTCLRQLASHLSHQPAVHGLPHLSLLQQLFDSEYAEELTELLHFCRGDLRSLNRALLVAYLELQLQAGEDSTYSGPDEEALRTSLHSFHTGVQEICTLQTTGTLSPQDAYQAIRKQWKQLKASKKALQQQRKSQH